MLENSDGSYFSRSEESLQSPSSSDQDDSVSNPSDVVLHDDSGAELDFADETICGGDSLQEIVCQSSLTSG
jgi:hypothetical protein